MKLICAFLLLPHFCLAQQPWLPTMIKSLSGFSNFTVALLVSLPYSPYATSFLGGTANAAAIGHINSIGNLGSFTGPYAMGWLKEHTRAARWEWRCWRRLR